jgi:hypothetical protein
MSIAPILAEDIPPTVLVFFLVPLFLAIPAIMMMPTVRFTQREDCRSLPLPVGVLCGLMWLPFSWKL